MGALDKLKKNRTALFDKVSKDFENKGGNFTKDEDKRFWKPTINKDGNGGAIFRFLPPVCEGDELPWARLYSYGFQGPTGKWYIENALSTIGQKDPVAEYNSEKWEASLALGGDEQKVAQDKIRDRKRKITFISNILVIKDPGNRENEGKVFLYKYGPQIHGMIEAKSKPETDEISGETPDPVYVYDAFEGANFRLKAKKKDAKQKYPSYETSEFESTPTALCDGDEAEMERVLSSCYPLAPFVAPDQFKSYDVLSAQLKKVLGLDGGSSSGSSGSSAPKGRTALESMDESESEPAPATKPVTKAKPAAAAKPAPVESEEDADQAFFRDLLAD